MAITIACSQCRGPLFVREELAGKQIQCARCQHVQTVPTSFNSALPLNAPPLTAAPAPVVVVPLERVVPIAQTQRSAQPAGTYKPCPRCGSQEAQRVRWTPWGSYYGTALVSHVRCPECGLTFNGKTGGSNTFWAILFVMVPALGILLVVGLLWWFDYHRMVYDLLKSFWKKR